VRTSPTIHYAPLDGGHVAYQVVGAGQVDLLVSSYGNASIDSFEDEPRLAHFMDSLAAFARVIRFDWRGVGLSDPAPATDADFVSARTDDMVAVLDAVGSHRCAVLAWMLAGPPAIALATSRPERVAALVFVNTTARMLQGEGYEFGVPREVVELFDEEVIAPEVEVETAEVVAVHAPSMAGDETFRRWWEASGRSGASPARARANLQAMMGSDVRGLLASVAVPSLVLQRRQSIWFRPEHGRYLAEHIPEAKLVWLAGSDMPPFTEGADAIVEEIEEFLTGERHVHGPDTELATVLCTDMVGSTELAASLGDRRWRDVLDRHDEITARQVGRSHGRVVEHTGDGALALFDSPARAIRCALSLLAAAPDGGFTLRAGVHTGEIESRAGETGGVAVHIGQRVCAAAGAGEVLVSRTVADLVAGGGFDLEDRGEHELAGVSGAWRLFRARP
jgi:class 3 adenylate cyclase